MGERVVETRRSDWRPWAIGVALAVGCAVFLLFRRQRSQRTDSDAYEEWWRHRERIRANGDQNPQLFV